LIAITPDKNKDINHSYSIIAYAIVYIAIRVSANFQRGIMNLSR